MNRPVNVAKVNTEMRNLSSSVATAISYDGGVPQTILVELRKYTDKGTLTYQWKADVATGELSTACFTRTLDEATMELSEEVPVSTSVPVRPSTQSNLRNIAVTPMRKQLRWNRAVGLLVSCAWILWNVKDSEVTVSFIQNGNIITAAIYDGIDVCGA